MRKQPTYRIKNGYYYIRFYDANGVRKERATGLRVGAQDQEFRVAFHQFCLQLNQPEQQSAGEYLISAALINYQREHAKGLASEKTIAHNINRLMEYWGHLPVSAINRASSRGYWQHRKGVSNATIRTELARLNAACEHERREGRLHSYTPAELPPDAPPRERWLTEDEILALYANVTEPHTRLFIDLALNTGQRPKAMLELKWFQVDFDNRLIRFNPPGRVETQKQRATVLMSDYLYQSLWQARLFAACEYVIEYKGRGITNIRRGIERLAKRAGIEGVTPYTFRHTTATHLAIKGFSDYQIGMMLGHRSAKTTRKYTKHAAHELEAVVNHMGKLGNFPQNNDM